MNLVFIRHGQSLWNLENKFTGWVDIDLSERGEVEAKTAGVTLIEILIGIVISVVMMAAMFTSYNVVNNSYSQVTDRAKISSQGRDVIGMMMRDIRNAG